MDRDVEITNESDVGWLLTWPTRGACVVICAGLMQSWALAYMWAFKPEHYEMFTSISRIGDPFEFGVSEGAERWIRSCHQVEGVAFILLLIAGIVLRGRVRLWPGMVVMLVAVPLAMACVVATWHWAVTGVGAEPVVWAKAWGAMVWAFVAGGLWGKGRKDRNERRDRRERDDRDGNPPSLGRQRRAMGDKRH